MNNLIRKKSTISGDGIFTVKDISKGEIIYTVPTLKIYNYPKSHCAHIGHNIYVEDKKILNFINHSCEPNVFLDISKKQPKIIALENIQRGNEVVCDYSKTEVGKFEKDCNCKSENCKGCFMSNDV